MTQHIGIVACSAEGAALCYGTICAEGSRVLGPLAHPEVSMHTPSLSRYVDCLERGDVQGVADLMLGSAHKLAACGADFLICPDNTIHQAFALVQPHSPRPWLHIAGAVADEAQRLGYRRLGLVGTAWLMASPVYPDKLAQQGLACHLPDAAAMQRMQHFIMEELVPGVRSAQALAFFQEQICQFRASGCDAVILGCTEIPLLIHDGNAALPTLDSTRLLARAALRRATQMPG